MVQLLGFLGPESEEKYRAVLGGVICSPFGTLFATERTAIGPCQKHVYILLTGRWSPSSECYKNNLAISATGMNNLRLPSTRNLNR